MRSILNILDLSVEEIDELIAVADDIMADPEKYQEVRNIRASCLR